MVISSEASYIEERSTTIPEMEVELKRVRSGKLSRNRDVDIVCSLSKGKEVHKRTAWISDPCEHKVNILLIINKEFQEAAEYVFNPRNSMYISKNDGMFNNSYNHKRDTIINMNTMVQLSRGRYTQAQLERIKALQQK